MQHQLSIIKVPPDPVYDGDTLVGLGRVIGDDGTTFHIADIVVKPSYQGKGSGNTIMTEISLFRH